MYTLLLRLSAPLQSWGSGSTYDRYYTDNIPTKSGVIGMLAAALGRRRDEPLNDLSELKFGVRVDLPGAKLGDSQITHMDRKRRANLSKRVYLSDAIFLAGLASEDVGFLQSLENALRNPEYVLFLGRKSCPPTLPLVLGIREKDLEPALCGEEWLVPEWMREHFFRFEEETPLRIILDS